MGERQSDIAGRCLAWRWMTPGMLILNPTHTSHSRVLMDFPQSISIWKTLTLRGQRCNIRQFLDIILTTERTWYRILERTCTQERTRIFQHTKLCTVWLVAAVLFTLFVTVQKELTDCTDIWIGLEGFAERDQHKCKF